MWKELLAEDKEEYKRMILAFASLTEMFAQKENNETPAPIINSKYQETVFQKVFKAFAEDLGNTSYDASLIHPVTKAKYLIGIKTFGIASGYQKVAQFKRNQSDWAELLSRIRANPVESDSSPKSIEEIRKNNRECYLELARSIARIRNRRIDSSISNMRGFKILDGEDFESVYHVLMPSPKGVPPKIYVGETNYDRIDIDNIQITSDTASKKTANFEFTDGHHQYRYTSADSQLMMSFNNRDIVLEQWEVKYADDAYSFFANIARKIYSKPEPKVAESYCWKIINKGGEVEPFSGFNAFYGVGSKLATKDRNKRVDKLIEKYPDIVDGVVLRAVLEDVRRFLIDEGMNNDKQAKVDLRKGILGRLDSIGNREFKEDVVKLLFRPVSELYIPIPDSKNFHHEHPDFFAKGLGYLDLDKIDRESKELRTFTLVFEPSGERLESFITQQNGKGIESIDSQSILGEWILRKVFQLDEYEPLTRRRLDEIGINGIRLYKLEGSPEVHFQFILIDDVNPPKDYRQ